LLGAPESVPNSVITKTDMRDPLLHRSHLSNTHRERQRGRETPVLFLKAPEAEGVAGAPCSGDGGLVGFVEMAGKDRGVRVHPPVASARPGVVHGRLPMVTSGATRGGFVGGACRQPTGPRKGRFEGGARRSRWCYAQLRTRRLGAGGTPTAMELDTTGYGGGAVTQMGSQ
jgi:hypothetical protein